jgi:hypothetical protein
VSTDPAGDLDVCVQALQDIIANPDDSAVIAERAIAKVVMRRMGLTVVPDGRVKVMIPAVAIGLRGWAKWCFGVEPQERGAYKFEGVFLRRGEPSPLPPGAVVILADGTDKGVHRATAFIVQPSGELGGNPITEPRGGWDDLAERIGDYLSARIKAPLLSPDLAFAKRRPVPIVPPPASAIPAAPTDAA